MGCCGEDDWVVYVAEIPVPTVFEKLFFEKVQDLTLFIRTPKITFIF
jgi:hypothetical protein